MTAVERIPLTIVEIGACLGCLHLIHHHGGQLLARRLLVAAGRLWHGAHRIVWLAAVHDDPAYRDREARKAARMMTLATFYARIAALLCWGWHHAATDQVDEGHRGVGGGRQGGTHPGR